MSIPPDFSPALLLENPRERVEAVFGRIAATRMADVSICNPALKVEAVGFRRWQEEWLGVLVTPWAINLMLLPGGGCAFRAIRVGDSQWWQFPSGGYEFFGNREDDLGPYQVCSLFSPVLDFESPEAARETAHCALVALLASPDEAGGTDACGPAPDGGEASRRAGHSLAGLPVSRRAFLRSLLSKGR